MSKRLVCCGKKGHWATGPVWRYVMWQQRALSWREPRIETARRCYRGTGHVMNSAALTVIASPDVNCYLEQICLASWPERSHIFLSGFETDLLHMKVAGGPIPRVHGAKRMIPGHQVWVAYGGTWPTSMQQAKSHLLFRIIDNINDIIEVVCWLSRRCSKRETATDIFAFWASFDHSLFKRRAGIECSSEMFICEAQV